MACSPKTPKYVIYDENLQLLCEFVTKNNTTPDTSEIKFLLSRSSLFLQFENTRYYRILPVIF